jgi:hypothetical protein
MAMIQSQVCGCLSGCVGVYLCVSMDISSEKENCFLPKNTHPPTTNYELVAILWLLCSHTQEC